MDKSQKLDSYLSHAMMMGSSSDLEGMTEIRGGGVESFADGKEARFPIMLRVERSAFQPEAIPGFSLKADMGPILAGTATEEAIQKLTAHPAVIALEASRSGAIEETAGSVPFVHGDVIHAPRVGEDGSKAIVALIDTGFDHLHECFRDGQGRTRIEALWDQRDPAGPSPAAQGFSPSFNFGTLYLRDDIDSLIAANTAPSSLLHSQGHGTHVASIAGGRAVGSFSGGMAPGARLIFVIPKLEVDGADPASLGYSVTHVAALEFIKAMAQNLDMPVVVNASFGMNAGAHDGSSLLEAAFDEFSGGGRAPGRTIVKSAGNERGKNGHARIAMPPGITDAFEWESRMPHIGPDNIEFWFAAANEFEFQLSDPLRNASGWVGRANPSESAALQGGLSYVMTLDRYFRDNGDSRLLVTIRGNHATPIPQGLFRLEVKSLAVPGDGQIDAWIEKGAVNTPLIQFTQNLSDEVTLSIPGTARTVISVASIRHVPRIQSSSFSSKGRSRDGRHKPDISAPGDGIIAAMSGTTNGTKADSGTSMAAPHVTGAIALAYSRCKRNGLRVPNAMQTVAALRGTATNSNGQHNTSLGYGVLDAKGLFDALT